MKKTILAVVLLLLTVSKLSAQDTLHWGDPRYYWDHLYSMDTMTDGNYLGSNVATAGIIHPQLYIDKTVTVYGLAFVSVRNSIVGSLMDLLNIYPHSIKIWQQGQSRLQITLLDSAHATPDAVYSHTRLLEYDIPSWCQPANNCRFIHHYVMDTSHHRVDTIVECFFNHPVVVHDSFLIAIHSDSIGFAANRLNFCTLEGYGNHLNFITDSSNIDYPSVEQWDWGYSADHCVGSSMIRLVMLPILQPRDTVVPNDITPCPAPNAPEMTILEDGQVFIYWDDNPDQSLEQQVALGTDIAGGPEGNSVTTYAAGRWNDTYSNLSPDSTYACWVRNQCRHQCVWHDTLVWGYWSEPLIFSTRDTTGGGSDPNEGMAEAGMNPITLHPNPTSGEVRIECGELSISTVELLDLQGRVLERQEPRDAQSSILNLQPYPVGTYIVRITTTEGTFTRRVTRK